MSPATQGALRRGPLAAAVPVAQCLLGAALLSRPARIGSALSGTRASAPPPWVVRLLGGRLLVQGAATLAQPGAATASVSAAVDATHAASMVFVAAVSHRYRRAALINVAIAGASAAASTKIATSELDRHR